MYLTQKEIVINVNCQINEHCHVVFRTGFNLQRGARETSGR